MYTAVVVAHDCLHNLSRFNVPSYVKFAPAIDTLLCGKRQLQWAADASQS